MSFPFPLSVRPLLRICRARGASWIGVSEPSTARRQMAVEHGASQVFDPMAEDVVAGIHKVTANQGIDVAFECAGIQATIDTALVALRSRGNYVNIALWTGAAQVSMNAVLLKEISITGEHNPCGRPSKSDCWIRYYWL